MDDKRIYVIAQWLHIVIFILRGERAASKFKSEFYKADDEYKEEIECQN